MIVSLTISLLNGEVALSREHVKNQDKELEISCDDFSCYDPSKACLVDVRRSKGTCCWQCAKSASWPSIFNQVFTLRPKFGVPGAELRLTHQNQNIKLKLLVEQISLFKK